MYSRILLLVAFLASSTYAADHNTFKNCSRVSFCASLRDANIDDSQKFSPDLDSINTDSKGAVLIDLTNENNDKLKLEIQLLVNNTLRLLIEESDSSRYRLQDVLKDGEPDTRNFTGVNSNSSAAVLAFGPEDDLYLQVVIKKSPFQIEFYKKDQIVSVFDGSRLIFEKDSSAFAFNVQYPLAEIIYGIHEHADNLTLQDTNSGEPYRLRNLDVSGYELHSTMALYGAVPVLYGHGSSATAGLFLHNAAEQWVEINQKKDEVSAYFMVETGMLDLFILLGSTPQEVVRQYTGLTGVAHLPQLWALGYHQCRWNYDSQEDVKDVIANMDNSDFPMDVIWLDIEYTDGKRYFTWDATHFSDPVEMQQNISSTNRKLVTIIDPHIKVDTDYAVYSGALANDLFVKNANGTVFEGDCWPGLSSYMDFLNPNARDYYASFYAYDKFPSSTETLAGIWNDMNEPSVFDDSIEKTIPGDALHIGGVLHKDIHNIYGLLHTRSTHQGLMQRDNGSKRPFLLSRSHFAGSQRYALIWTGDNTADWGYLAISYSECLNANILGIVFCGADIGGFAGEPDEELLQRWYQAGAWLPFYRAHANMGTKRREPYLFSSEVQEVIRDSLRLRYRHLPVWYTLFFEHTQSGDPIIRPLFYQYPSDATAMRVDSQVLVGENILVKAVAEPEVQSVSVYLPGENETWYQLHKNESNAFSGGAWYEIDVDISFIPIFYRAGGIITTKDTPRASSEDMKEDPVTLIANLDKDKIAKGSLYSDDYVSFAYQDNNDYSYLELEVIGDELRISQKSGLMKNVNLKIDSIIVNHLPEGGAGVFEQTVHKTVNNGQVLRDMKIDLKEALVLKLN